MPKILIENVDVVSLDDAGTVYQNVALAIDGSEILAVGEAPPSSPGPRRSPSRPCIGCAAPSNASR